MVLSLFSLCNKNMSYSEIKSIGGFMKKIKTLVSDNVELILCGLAIASIVVITIVINNTEFIKGAKELMVAQDEGRLTTDF
jgi:hypothetical protein